MKPSEVAQAACDKLSFTDSATLALAKKFCIRRYSMIWDSCLWNDTLGVVSTSVTNGQELVTISQYVTAMYASGTGYNMFLDFPVAIRFTIDGETELDEQGETQLKKFVNIYDKTGAYLNESAIALAGRYGYATYLYGRPKYTYQPWLGWEVTAINEQQTECENL